jgi:hypothetical protein
MTITVFGATGQVGRQIVSQALDEGLKVRAFSRDVNKLIDEDLRNENFQAIQGYVFDKRDIKRAIDGVDGVLCALGGATDTSDKTRSLGMKNICEQMKETGLRRIIAVGGLGVLKDDEHEFILNRPDYPNEYKAVGQEHLAAFQYMVDSQLDFSFYCPPNIVDAPPDGRFITVANYPPTDDTMQIYTGNLALSMLQTLMRNEYLNCRVGICNK